MVLKIFKENLLNPAYGLPERPAVFFDFHIGDVHFILLDGRTYREDAGRFSRGDRIQGASMLGPHQLRWLKETLANSNATFTVLVSPVPWNFTAKGSGIPSRDTWAGYKEEREEIFSWREQHRIEGVVLLSADRHRSEAWLIERPNGYDLYEFASSQLTNQHTHGKVKGSLFSYNGKNSFGLLRFVCAE